MSCTALGECTAIGLAADAEYACQLSVTEISFVAQVLIDKGFHQSEAVDLARRCLVARLKAIEEDQEKRRMSVLSQLLKTTLRKKKRKKRR